MNPVDIRSEKDTSVTEPATTNPQGRRVLITGAASGLGAALARAFAANGDRVLLTDMTAAADTPEGDTSYLLLDVTSQDAWDYARVHVDEIWGGLDVLVNNAGVAGGGRLDVVGEDEWNRVLDINLLGAVRGIKAFGSMLKESDGDTAIVNIASLAGIVHPAGMGCYSASKAAVLALTETIRHEFGHAGVHAMAVCPSYFKTALSSSLSDADEVVSEIAASLVTQAEEKADEIAAEVLRGLDAGETLLLPDDDAKKAVAMKHDDPEAYAAQMAKQAASMRKRAGEDA